MQALHLSMIMKLFLMMQAGYVQAGYVTKIPSMLRPSDAGR